MLSTYFINANKDHTMKTLIGIVPSEYTPSTIAELRASPVG